MSTPDEQKGNVESSGTGERMDSASMFPGARLPSLEPVRAQETTFQEPEPILVELLANLSHEFRTPLTVIKGYTSMLLHQAHSFLQRNSTSPSR